MIFFLGQCSTDFHEILKGLLNFSLPPAALQIGKYWKCLRENLTAILLFL